MEGINKKKTVNFNDSYNTCVCIIDRAVHTRELATSIPIAPPHNSPAPVSNCSPTQS